MPSILIIDDEKSIRKSLRDILEYENFNVDEAEDGFTGIEKVKNNRYDVILCDIKMPRMDGIEVLEKISEFSDIPVVMISGHGTIESAVEAIKKGAFDYISKPLDLNRLLVTIRNAIDRASLIEETKALKKRINVSYEMIGKSSSISHIRDLISRVSSTDARVLITGENGTGKELVARAIHENSTRSSGNFIEVNCAAIPSELIESQLFGHEKGSFTSAIKQRKGDFEQAGGGTLFLDEIGDMSLSAQAKVLRALQENKIVRVGGEKEIPVDVRVIAATNKNLNEEIRKGRFREDLFHRISVIIINVPPLRERKDDIPLLVEHFYKEAMLDVKKSKIIFEDDAIESLKNLPWSGNIRELRNVVERLVILCDKKVTKKDIDLFARPIIYNY